MSQGLLSAALRTNALFSTISGLIMLTRPAAVAAWIGIGKPAFYLSIGVGLLAFALFTLYTARTRPINTFFALLISLGDLAWVVGSAAAIAIFFSSLGVGGLVTIGGVAALVLLFALLQLRGIERVFADPDQHGAHRVCVRIETPAPAGALWEIIADLDAIGRYSPNLRQVVVRNGAESEPGAVRQCTSTRGDTWAEQCTRLDHRARALEVAFLTDEPNFPYPFRTMHGGWEVDEINGGSAVTIWFRVTPKIWLAQPFVLAVMARTLAPDFGEIVARMVADVQGEKPASPTSTIRPLPRTISGSS